MDTKNTIEQFIVELLKQKDMSGLEPEVVDQLKLDLYDRVEDRINAAILANIPENKLGEFDSLLDLGDDVKTQNFVIENVPNIEEVIATELVNFQRMYVS